MAGIYDIFHDNHVAAFDIFGETTNYVGILSWAVLLGVAFRGAKDTTKAMLSDISDGISKVVASIINLAPFGILGLVYASVTSSGLETFTVCRGIWYHTKAGGAFDGIYQRFQCVRYLVARG